MPDIFEQIKELGTDSRAAEILLDALTGMGLLKKQKDKYKNSDLASKFLVSGTPYYQGDIIKHADILWQNWSGLDKVVKTGKPYHQAQDHDSFILGMHNIAVLKTNSIIKEIGLKGVKTALDLGGGPGTYAIEMAKKGIKVTLFDRPETVKIARRVIDKIPLYPPLPKGESSPLSREVSGVYPTLKKGGEGGFKNNISFIQGDFLEDDFGKGYDLIFISQILHAYSEKDCVVLLRKCRKALNDKGRIVIQEFYINEDRAHPLPGALFSINMLVNTEGGRCYSLEEIKNWLLKTEFKKTQKKIIADCVLISGKR